MRKTLVAMLAVIIFTGFISAQSLTVKSPNGGEVWTLGTKQKITWTASGVTNKIRILLYKNDQWLGLIKGELNPNIGYYEWTVGTYLNGNAQPGTKYKIKIKDEENPTIDFSNNYFTLKAGIIAATPNTDLIKKAIQAAPPKVTVPHKGTNWKEGNTETIRWETIFKPPFKVELYNYNGKTKIRDCAGQVISEGGIKYSMNWYIPKDVYKWPGNYTVRVSQGNKEGFSEMFHIQKALAVKTYTFSATTVNKYREKWYKPDKNKFTMKIEPSAQDPGAGKARVGYENHDTSDLYTGFIYRSWVYFDVSQLKGKGLVSKAYLTYKHFMGCQFTPGVYALNQKWSGDPSSLFTISCRNVDPGNLGVPVSDWIFKNSNYGLVLVGQDETFKHNNSKCVDFYENIVLTVELLEDAN